MSEERERTTNNSVSESDTAAEPVSQPPERGGKDTFRRMVFFIAIIVFVVAVGMIIYYFVDSYRTKQLSEDLRNIYHSSTEATTNDGGETTTPPSDDNIIEVENEFSDPDWLPGVAELYKLNSEVAGWVKINGTQVDLPVVHRPDAATGNEYYLTHNFVGEYSRAGTIFADYRCTITKDEQSDNIILYGHNQGDNSMFGDLDLYKTVDLFYRLHPIVEFSTNYETGYYKIVSLMILNTREEHGEVFDYQNYITLTDENRFNYFVEQIRMRSLFDNDIDIEYGDKLLTLSTCGTEFDDSRFVIVARKVREGESTDVNMGAMKRNPNVLYPDIWYAYNGGSYYSTVPGETLPPEFFTTTEDSSLPSDSLTEDTLFSEESTEPTDIVTETVPVETTDTTVTTVMTPSSEYISSLIEQNRQTAATTTERQTEPPRTENTTPATTAPVTTPATTAATTPATTAAPAPEPSQPAASSAPAELVS